MTVRKTNQRRAIRRAFLRAGRPMTPKEVIDAAMKDSPNLGIATVYRTIKLLLEEGWLTPAAIPGEPDRYEVSGKSHHHHFICRDCKKAYDVEACPENIAAIAPEGFELEDHEITLYGRCPDCVAP